MINIALCSTKNEICKNLQYCISNYLSELNQNSTVNIFKNESELIKTDIKYDLIFLYIDEKKQDNLDKAKQIRKHNRKTTIIIIAENNYNLKNAFIIHAYDYLFLPVNQKKVIRILNDYLELIEDYTDYRLALHAKDDNEEFFIDTDKIAYIIFKEKRTVLIHTIDDIYKVSGTLSDIYSCLDKKIFYQSRRDCIVNMKYVSKIINNYVIVMRNGDFLPLAQKKKSDFLQNLSRLFIDNFKTCS